MSGAMNNVVFFVAGILRMNKEWLVLVTAGLHQIDCGTSMVAWRILFNDGDVVVTPHTHSIPPLLPHIHTPRRLTTPITSAVLNGMN